MSQLAWRTATQCSLQLQLLVLRRYFSPPHSRSPLFLPNDPLLCALLFALPWPPVVAVEHRRSVRRYHERDCSPPLLPKTALPFLSSTGGAWNLPYSFCCLRCLSKGFSPRTSASSPRVVLTPIPPSGHPFEQVFLAPDPAYPIHQALGRS